RNLPGRYSTRTTRPETGVRLMCTSIGERKIVICFHVPGGAHRPSLGPAIITRPSAGDTTKPGASGMWRSGSRKKYAMKPPSAANGAAQAKRRMATSNAAGTAAAAMNGYPARSILIEGDDARKRGRKSRGPGIGRRLGSTGCWPFDQKKE